MYADVLFIENFVIDYLLLSMTARFSKLRTSQKRLSLGALAGALYVMAVFLPPISGFLSSVVKVLMSALMVLIVFAPERLNDLLKALGILYLVSCAIGGAAFLCYFFTGRGYILNGIFYISDFSLSLLITAIGAGYMLLVCCLDYARKKSFDKALIYGITVVIDKRQADMAAMVDTGSSLKDPISGYPVILTEYRMLSEILPDCMCQSFCDDSAVGGFEKAYKCLSDTEWAARVRLIPYSSVGEQNGMLIGIRPDVVRVKQGEHIREYDRVVVGICDIKLSSSGDYQALFNPELLY